MRVTNIQLLSSNNGGGEGGSAQQQQQQYQTTNSPDHSMEKNSYAPVSSSVSETNQMDTQVDAGNGDGLPF